MSQLEEEFLRRLRATFKVEAEEHVRAMSSGLMALEKSPHAPENVDVIETVFRHAHSLKGAARATNFSTVETICHPLESVFARWKSQPVIPTAEQFDAVHRAVDYIGKLIDAPVGQRSAADEQACNGILRSLGALSAGEPVHTPARDRSPPPDSLAPPPVSHAMPRAEEREPEAKSEAPAGKSALTDTIRVPTGKLDHLLLQVEELLTVKQAASERLGALQEFGPLLDEWNGRWMAIQPQLRLLPAEAAGGGVAALHHFLNWNFEYVKSLEVKLRSLAKSAGQDRYEVAKRVDDLLGDSKKLVMLPFSTLSDLFPKLVRDLSRDQGKAVDLVMRGTDVEVDKRILEEMKDPLIHLLRNCIDHGIEKPGVDARANKSPRATITITATTVSGNKLELVVSDDGRGIDVQRVKESAVRRGFLTAEEAQALSAERAHELIFRSEVSTSPLITEISGRGLGLAIVREKTEKLGGRVFVESRKSEGTTFRMILPLTMATFRGVLVRAAGSVFVIPTAQVERVVRVKRTEVLTVENRETVRLHERAVSLVNLRDVLELNAQDVSLANRDILPLVVLGSGDAQIAFAVDDVLHEEEVLVKSLTRPLSRVRNIAGATVLAAGKLAPILNTADLMKSARKNNAPAPRTGMGKGLVEKKAKSVLVAEDSITSRMLLKGILESAGYEVTTAVDGADAWATLRMGSFDVVVSDVEMPRLSGFDLTAQIRADRKLAHTPVVLVTALASSADRERGVDVGASAYITKSGFDQGNLLEVVGRLA